MQYVLKTTESTVYVLITNNIYTGLHNTQEHTYHCERFP